MYRICYKAFYTVFQMVFYEAYIGYIREKQGIMEYSIRCCIKGIL